MRGTTPNKPFKQDREYSNKSYPFLLNGQPDSKRVYVFESPIDAMSRATIAKLRGQDWKAAYYISLECLSDQALERFLQYNAIQEIVFVWITMQMLLIAMAAPLPIGDKRLH